MDANKEHIPQVLDVLIGRLQSFNISKDDLKAISELVLKQCVCGEDLFKGHWITNECFCCCREFDKKTKDFYWCTKGETTCEYTKMNGVNYRVCAQCYEEMESLDNLSGDEFTFHKIMDTIQTIS